MFIARIGLRSAPYKSRLSGRGACAMISIISRLSASGRWRRASTTATNC